MMAGQGRKEIAEEERSEKREKTVGDVAYCRTGSLCGSEGRHATSATVGLQLTTRTLRGASGRSSPIHTHITGHVAQLSSTQLAS